MELRFGRVMTGSLIVHALLIIGVLLLPAGGGAPETIPIYTVKIVEAPTVPEARALDLSPALRRELKLEAPSLNTNAPPLPTAPAPDVTGLEAPRLPSSAAALPPAPGKPSPTAPPAGAALPDAPSSQLVLPTPPSLPQPPSARTAAKPPGGSPPPPPSSAESSALPPPPAPPDAPSLQDRLRAKVQDLKLQVESEPAKGVPQPSAEKDNSLISLRLFQNTVRERVKKNYTFPGSFPENLRARVRVEIERSGALRSLELVEPSGNDRFDKLVCLAAIRNAKFPPLPSGIEGDTHTLFLTCSP